MKKIAAVIALTLFISLGAFATASHAQAGPVVLAHTLSVGSSEADVSILQQFLKDQGFFAYPAITGYFGLMTKAAVAAFQQAYDINPVGVAGPITRGKILELTQPAQGLAVAAPRLHRSGGPRHSTSRRNDNDDDEDDEEEVPAPVDTDEDGVSDDVDNCPSVANADQADDDADMIGNACDTPSSYALTVSRVGAGSGMVTSSPAGINCGATCSALFSAGSMVTLTAAPAGGSYFIGWFGAGCSGTGACVVTMDAIKALDAYFDNSEI